MRVSLFSMATMLSLLAGCTTGEMPHTPRPAASPIVIPLDSPAAPGSLAPNLFSSDGTLHLSWLEPDGEGHALRFSSWQGENWSAPRTIAAGENWFVNWADFPSIAVAVDGTLAAHWLVRSGPGTYAYDVQLAVSGDGGESWSRPVTPHRDGTQTEHGFASLVPLPEGGFDVVWLDGREMTAGHSGVMTLRSAPLDGAGVVGDESIVDTRVCDCCSTDAARTADGTLVTVFRDRTESEIRDISVSRLEAEGWTAPVSIHDDGWKISACPVNGPAMAVSGERIAVAWFSGADGDRAIHVAFSNDGGRSFDPPHRLDDGDAIGRVDVVLVDDANAVVSWVAGGALKLRRVDPNGPRADVAVATSADESRAGGFPRLARVGQDLFLAWTEPGEPSHVRTGRIPLDTDF